MILVRICRKCKKFLIMKNHNKLYREKTIFSRMKEKSIICKCKNDN